MMKILMSCAITAVVTATLTLALAARANVNSNNGAASAFAPPCSPAVHSADGNFTPLFCMVDNPAALKWYASTGEPVFALGPGASRQAVYSALKNLRGGTFPIDCSIYQLAAWRNHWHFSSSPIAQVIGSNWCQDPSFNGG